MSYLTQVDYLKEQYRDSANLEARIALHERFSRNKQGWMHWVFDQIDLSPACRLLELGCGSGKLWIENRERIPAGWRLVLSDASAGMAATARHGLQGLEPLPAFSQIHAACLPFPTASFEAVIANFMLYHVRERSQAVAEFRRVLRQGGRLYAATAGEQHLREIDGLARGFASDMTEFNPLLIEFSLENGGEQLAEHFSRVEMRRYPDALDVTEAEPLVAYIVSGSRSSLIAGRVSEFRAWIEAELERQGGVIHVTKDAGLFIAE